MADRRKRIAVVVPKYGLLGGGEKFVFELTERLAPDPRWEIHVFANQWRRGTDLVRFHHVPIIKFPRFARPLSFAGFARQKINRLGVDLIHTHERIFDAHIYSVHGIPHPIWVKQIRGKKSASLFDRSLTYVERRLVNSPNCKSLLAVSSITADYLQMAFDGISERIRVVPPGVDLEPFARWPKQACRQDLRAKCGWHPEDRVLLFVGMNFEIKGLDQILAAMAQLHPCAAAPRLLVVGKGDARKYTQMAKALGIADRVRFMGQVTSDIERIYLGSDLFLLMSQFDTFGLVVLEAMAAGLPVVVSRHVGAKDIIRDGVNGFVVDAEDTYEISRCIRLSLAPERNAAMAAGALATARANTWSATAHKVAAVYEEILWPGRGSPQGVVQP